MKRLLRRFSRTRSTSASRSLASDLLNDNPAVLQILDAIHDMVLIKGPKSRIRWGNRAFRDYYGMSNDELRGLIDAPFAEPDYTEQYVRDDHTVFTEKRTVDIPCEPVKRHDGEVRYFHTVKSPIFDTSGNVVLSVGVSRDITDQRLAEERLVDHQQRMIVSAKMASLGEMAGNIAHEINNPLMVIGLRARRIIRALEQDSSGRDEALECANGISLMVARIKTIITSLRRFSRDDDRDPRRAAPLRPIIDETLLLCQENYEHDGIEIVVSGRDDLILAACLPVRISQVFMNLLTNARDALLGQRGMRRIEIHIGAKDDRAMIRFKDNGAGIAPENHEKIFTAFFTTKSEGLGTGLGLGISKRIVEDHGGSLSLDMTSPETCFVVELPLVTGDESADST